MIKNLPIILLIVIVLYVVYSSQLMKTVSNTIINTITNTITNTDLNESEDRGIQYINSGNDHDSGMYDVHNANAFGTTLEADRRITNDGVRKEYHHNPFPWGECGNCDAGNCDKHGVPDPTPGQTHVCKNGFPSKRIVDMYGSHFQLNHICAGQSDNSCGNEPAVLGRWFERCGCSNPESVGLGVRPACTRCG